MQNVRNMPPLPTQHLLPAFFQIMARNPKYNQFQAKGHLNEENPQSMTKIPRKPKFDPFHLVKLVPKLGKLKDYNLFSSGGGQDTSAYIISGYFHDTPGNAPKTQMLPFSLSQNSTKIRKFNRPWS